MRVGPIRCAERPVPPAGAGMSASAVRRRSPDAMPPEGFCRTLDELLARQERQRIWRRLRQAMLPTARRSSAPPLPPAAWRIGWPQPPKMGPERLALDLQRMMLDYPSPPEERGVPP